MKRQEPQRLGSGPEDAAAVQSHPFFKHVNWDDVVARRLEPPIKPLLVSPKMPYQLRSIALTIRIDSSLNSEARMMFPSLTRGSQGRYLLIHRMIQRSAKVPI